MLVKVLQFDNKEELQSLFFCSVKSFYEIKGLLYSYGYKNIKYYNNKYLIDSFLDNKLYPYRINKKDYRKEVETIEAMNKFRNEYNKITIIHLNDIKL